MNRPAEPHSHHLNRRAVLGALSAAAVGTVGFQRTLAARVAETGEVTAEMIAAAEWVAGLELTDEQRGRVVRSIGRLSEGFERLRAVPLDNATAPALVFRPDPWHTADEPAPAVPPRTPATVERPEGDEDLAFLPVWELAGLLHAHKVTSLELTELYLERLKRFDPVLNCVVTLTEDLAREQAKAADAEIAAGRWKGPLHGVPWGAKDLMAVPGYPTTWGAPQYREQRFDEPATVYQRLTDAGAVCVAKLSLGALAMGDRWFGGMTRNPWNPKQGSSGSSAGSAAAVSAGLVGFAIGTETYGSIVSPCRRCKVTGLRPTFGRVSRAGCMALSWTMDKVGPIVRSVSDADAILRVIQGPDGRDASVVQRPLPAFDGDFSKLNVGYFAQRRTPAADRADLQVLRDLGATLWPIELPGGVPAGALLSILTAEAASAFDDLVRTGAEEGLNSWPDTFREGQFIPAVEYLRANRLRSRLMADMRQLMDTIDLYVGGDDLLVCNLTGHPTVVLPDASRAIGGASVPSTTTFTGRLYGEATLLAVAGAYQSKVGAHRLRPDMDRLRELADAAAVAG